MNTTFDKFWSIYPKKVAKKAARKVWNRINPSNGLFEIIILSLEQQVRSPDWKRENGTFIPHPATWLNGERWEDEVYKPVIAVVRRRCVICGRASTKSICDVPYCRNHNQFSDSVLAVWKLKEAGAANEKIT